MTITPGSFDVGMVCGEGPLSTCFFGRRKSDDEPAVIRVTTVPLHPTAHDVLAQTRSRLRSSRASQAGRLVATLEARPLRDGRDVSVRPRLDRSLADQLITRGPRGAGSVLILLLGILETLQMLHEEGFVHGSITPANLFVQSDGTPLIADVGQSPIPLAEPAATALAPEHVALRAPELLEAGKVATPASDAYALCLTVRLLATGRNPFMRTPESSGVEALARVLQSEPPPVAITGDASLDRLLLTGLSKEPAARPGVEELCISAEAAQSRLRRVGPPPVTESGPPLRREPRSGSTTASKPDAPDDGNPKVWGRDAEDRTFKPGEPQIPTMRDAVELGAGGFGKVYRAREDGRDEEVAVKVLFVPLRDKEGRKRFEREVRVLRRLRTAPNVVRLLGSGYTLDNFPYLVMPLLAGSLEDRMSDGPLAWEALRPHVRPLCAALGAAHEQGIFHRDVKPDNILFDDAGVPHLADFGIARIQGGTVITRRDELRLTLGYAPPEALESAAPAATGDVYSTCATLMAALRGVAAFTDDDPSTTQLIGRILTSAPPDLTRIGVPKQVADTLRRGMSKDPAARPQTMLELAELLDA